VAVVEAAAPYFGMKIVWEGEGIQEKGIDNHWRDMTVFKDRPYTVSTCLELYKTLNLTQECINIGF
jgi:hypothetical protein